MYTTETTVRVNYSMTDKMGYVFFGNYPTFYDIGRTELLRELGMSTARLEKMGIMLPVRKIESDYLHPALYDELLTIRTTLKKISPLRLDFQFEIFNSEKIRLNLGHLQLIFVDSQTRSPRRSEDIVHQIKQQIHEHA